MTVLGRLFRNAGQELTLDPRKEAKHGLAIGCTGLGVALTLGLSGCGQTEPSEAEMKGAMEYFLNHPPGEKVSDPIKVAFFKKEVCDKPTPQGYGCTFTVRVTSRNMFAQMFNNVPRADFYEDKDSGKWMMRPPF
jgi:hypothetical protein